jgi:hypothetical protein
VVARRRDEDEAARVHERAAEAGGARLRDSEARELRDLAEGRAPADLAPVDVDRGERPQGGFRQGWPFESVKRRRLPGSKDAPP